MNSSCIFQKLVIFQNHTFIVIFKCMVIALNCRVINTLNHCNPKIVLLRTTTTINDYS